HARRLPEKFFYWFPLSVRAWLALCSDGAYRNFVRSRSLIARSAAELARLFPPGPLEVLSLGAGQGDKDLILLEALREHGVRVSYVPVATTPATACSWTVRFTRATRPSRATTIRSIAASPGRRSTPSGSATRTATWCSRRRTTRGFPACTSSRSTSAPARTSRPRRVARCCAS